MTRIAFKILATRQTAALIELRGKLEKSATPAYSRVKAFYSPVICRREIDSRRKIFHRKAKKEKEKKRRDNGETFGEHFPFDRVLLSSTSTTHVILAIDIFDARQ